MAKKRTIRKNYTKRQSREERYRLAMALHEARTGIDLTRAPNYEKQQRENTKNFTPRRGHRGT